eukprot:TRINITY_DN115137_c0_g1_i1.p1 TRINITY_DN115137_c0_g1~~TRINITY_DN115137_c0_g1_i1.p1  ORF type:complete len:157 (+),score=16.75 TRINITY_DN115137_c0_g1_i1:45-515(+)
MPVTTVVPVALPNAGYTKNVDWRQPRGQGDKLLRRGMRSVKKNRMLQDGNNPGQTPQIPAPEAVPALPIQYEQPAMIEAPPVVVQQPQYEYVQQPVLQIAAPPTTTATAAPVYNAYYPSQQAGALMEVPSTSSFTSSPIYAASTQPVYQSTGYVLQ